MSRHPIKSGRLSITVFTHCVRVSSTTTTANFFNRLWIVAAQGVFLCVKPSAFASAGCERTQVTIDVYPYVHTSNR
ncbi:MAG: hypothetical protein OXI67_14545 [Candidatus Poribacteria bacterium]|nr:hypothetical protein [Candidatus Poribacteria bacterium]